NLEKQVAFPQSLDGANGRLRIARSRHRAAASASQDPSSLDFFLRSSKTEKPGVGREGAAGLRTGKALDGMRSCVVEGGEREGHAFVAAVGMLAAARGDDGGRQFVAWGESREGEAGSTQERERGREGGRLRLR
uniref:Uncharacterized protein n=1 Tax=Aegilops tauschii subsp. strangulata TaxID=200361 RepID=A0A453JRD4_AEGTS